MSQTDHQQRIGLLVLGMHRSGTSAIARILNQLGAALPEHVLPPSDGNKAGHWEPASLVELDDRILTENMTGWDDWSAIDFAQIPAERRQAYLAEISKTISREFGDHEIFVLKEPRICRLAPLYLEALGTLGIAPRIVIPFRNPLAVAASLERRSGIDTRTSQLFWLRHVLDAERASRATKRIFIDFDTVMREWRTLPKQLKSRLSVTLADADDAIAAEIDRFLEPDLQHFRVDALALEHDPDALDWSRRAFAALQRLELDEGDADASRTLDAVAAEFDPYAALFAPQCARMRESSFHAHAKLSESERDLEEIQRDLEKVQRELEQVLREREHMQSVHERLTEAARTLTGQLDAASDALVTAQRTLEIAERERTRLTADVRNAATKQIELTHALDKARADIEFVRQSYLQSTSWKVTAPLRAVMSSVRRPPADSQAKPAQPMPAPKEFRGVVRALRFHGVGGAVGKAYQMARTRGVKTMLRHGFRSIGLHAAVAHSEAHAGPQQFLDERIEFSVQLGARAAPAQHPDPSVFIISETELDQCIRYRIRNKLETFEAKGVRAGFGDLRDLFASLSEMQFYRTLLIYRAPMHDLFMTYHDEARRLGMSIVYDLDDPIFERSVLGGNSNLKVIESHYRTGQLRDAAKFRQAMEASDYLLASTPALAELMRGAVRGKPAFVWRNAADRRALEIGSSIRTRTPHRKDGRILVGYFSGSLAHEADFNLAAPALAELLASRPDVDLMMFGHVRPRAELAVFGDRVRTGEFSGYERYLEVVAGCDVVIVPLVDDDFNRCKSIVRYLDAAVVETPVIASAVGDYEALLTDGRTGWLVRDPRDWGRLLDQACASPEVLREVGLRARALVEAQYSTQSCMPALDADLGGLLFGDAFAPAGH